MLVVLKKYWQHTAISELKNKIKEKNLAANVLVLAKMKQVIENICGLFLALAQPKAETVSYTLFLKQTVII